MATALGNKRPVQEVMDSSQTAECTTVISRKSTHERISIWAIREPPPPSKFPGRLRDPSNTLSFHPSQKCVSLLVNSYCELFSFFKLLDKLICSFIFLSNVFFSKCCLDKWRRQVRQTHPLVTSFSQTGFRPIKFYKVIINCSILLVFSLLFRGRESELEQERN